MKPKIIFLNLLMMIGLSLASCAPKPPVTPTVSPSETAASSPVDTQTATFEPTMTPTLAPTYTSTTTESSSPTSLLATPTPAMGCFISNSIQAAFIHDSTRLALREDKGVRFFNLKTKKSEAELLAFENKRLLTMAISPDGNILAWAVEDNTIQLIQISNKQLIATLSGTSDVVTKLKFSPDSARLYSASHDTWVRVWDMKGNLLHKFQPTGADNLPNQVLGMAVSPDGKLLATIPSDGPVKLWDLDNYQLVRELGAFGGYDTSDAVFSPDGKYLAADTVNGLFLWKVSDGTQLMGGNPGVNSEAAAFSPDGRFLVYSEIGQGTSIVVSSPDGVKKIHTIKGDLLPIWDLTFSPDGSLLAASGVVTQIWQVEGWQLLYVGKGECP